VKPDLDGLKAAIKRFRAIDNSFVRKTVINGMLMYLKNADIDTRMFSVNDERLQMCGRTLNKYRTIKSAESDLIDLLDEVLEI